LNSGEEIEFHDRHKHCIRGPVSDWIAQPMYSSSEIGLYFLLYKSAKTGIANVAFETVLCTI